jgi:hypothetical protein
MATIVVKIAWGSSGKAVAPKGFHFTLPQQAALGTARPATKHTGGKHSKRTGILNCWII